MIFSDHDPGLAIRQARTPVKNDGGKLPNIKSPCKDCPFRKDSLKGWLGRDRAEEIANSNSFVCHKTLRADRKQCAGHMLLIGNDNDFVRLASLLDLDTGLHGAELVHDTVESFIAHHDRTGHSAE